MTRIMLVSNERIGRRMAGPGIRYFSLARELAQRFEITLVVPAEPDIELDFADVHVAPSLSYRRFLQLARRSDVLVAQQLGASAMRRLAGGSTKIVYDLYDPLLIETLPLLAGRPAGDRLRELTHRNVTRNQVLALATGDAFLCASERQRDLWLGILTAIGRVDVASYADDPTLRRLIDVVPFGIDPEPPRATGAVLRGVVPGIRDSDAVLLWGGGIWDWFDPLTVIRAVGRIAESRDDVKLYFLGGAHPNPATEQMSMPERAGELARELGLERTVFFNREWVDYAVRSNYLLEADIGVSAHAELVESRYAFRTRLLDYFWAGLPTLTTEGDVLADLVVERGLGRATRVGDVDGWVTAITDLVDDDDERARIRGRLAAVREQFAWPRLAERLAEIALGPPSSAPVATTVRSGLRTVAAGGMLTTGGMRGLVADAIRPFQQPPVP